MPDFVQTAVKDIDDQLRVLKDEASRLRGSARCTDRRNAPARAPSE